MTEITYRPAVRRAGFAMIGLGGPSGGGKTLSALKLARGLAMGVDESIFALDSENGRMLHYACAEGEQPDAEHFRFQYAELGEPFSPMAYQDAIVKAVQAKAAVVIVDSMSHEHEGVGGLLEWHDRELYRMAKDDLEKRDRVKFTAWIEPKKAHNKLVNRILQSRCHFIFCFRAKDKIAPVKNAKGKIEFISVGWTPICSDRFEFEMTTMLILPPNAKGVPDLGAERTKLQGQHAPAFPAGKALDEEAGRAMARWCTGKSLAAAPAQPGRREKPPPPSAKEGGPAPEPRGERAKAPEPAPQYHEDMIATHRELRAGLEATNEPEMWWRNHPIGIANLKDSARGLYDDLVALAKTKKAGGLLV